MSHDEWLVREAPSKTGVALLSFSMLRELYAFNLGCECLHVISQGYLTKNR